MEAIILQPKIYLKKPQTFEFNYRHVWVVWGQIKKNKKNDKIHLKIKIIDTSIKKNPSKPFWLNEC